LFQKEANLILDGSIVAAVGKKKIIEGKEDAFDASIVATYEKNTFKFDRSVEPAYGESPDVNYQQFGKKQVVIGLNVLGIENHEIPLVQFQLQIKGGMLLEETNKIEELEYAGRTDDKKELKTQEQLENAIESLEQPLERMQVMNLYLFQEIP
jgi:zinc protease